ncbi:hypothetical protein Poly41_56750 [Novipirellula artificiosorum]|uniref:Uncharacterized protein n=1 Tax=Novipirellula artificiosorum TaxID=2528016 RepID=A0A5C6D5R0_9BACT|nr:hypothetical protein Poly41_56750 [Novipirellula artificiosorum]
MTTYEIDGAFREVVRQVLVFDWQSFPLNIKCVIEVGQHPRAIKALELIKASCKWVKAFPASDMPFANEARRPQPCKILTIRRTSKSVKSRVGQECPSYECKLASAVPPT